MTFKIGKLKWDPDVGDENNLVWCTRCRTQLASRQLARQLEELKKSISVTDYFCVDCNLSHSSNG